MLKIYCFEKSTEAIVTGYNRGGGGGGRQLVTTKHSIISQSLTATQSHIYKTSQPPYMVLPSFSKLDLVRTHHQITVEPANSIQFV